MVTRLIRSLGILCLFVTAAIGSDRPSKNTPPVPSRTKEEHSGRILQQGVALHETADDAPEVQRTHKLKELRQQANEIERQIREIEGLAQQPAQLEVDFKAVEIDLAELDRLGFQWETIRPNVNDTTVQTADHVGKSNSLDTIPQESLRGFVEGLISNGSAKVLSDVTMNLSSGRPATLFSGGEFPILVPQADDTVSIEWRTCGTHIEVLADVLQDGRLQLQVALEYGWKDFSSAIRLHGMVIPEVATVRLNTQVEMEFGRALLLSGETSSGQASKSHTTEPGQELKVDAMDESPTKKRVMVLVTPRRLQAAAD